MASKLKLFTPSKIGNLKIKNRVVRSATYLGMATDKGEVSDKLISIYETLAKNEIGLIISEYMYVTRSGKAGARQLGIYDDFLIESLKRLVSSVKDYDVKFFTQIAHVGRQKFVSGLKTANLIAPSPIMDKTVNIMPKEMTIEDINNCIKGFIDAARRTYEAGFDGVQLHCAHGYLLSEFISPYCNQRKDLYGGSIENRFRIINDIIIGIQDEVDKKFPIISKLNVADFVGPNEPQLRIEESKIFAKIMVDLGVTAIETSGGLMESMLYGDYAASRIKIKKIEDEAYFLEEAKEIKKEIGNFPVILVGGIKSLEVAEKVLHEGMDFIAMSRPFIREPDLIKKWKSGKSKKSECTSCTRCFTDFSPKGVKCVVLEKLERKKELKTD